MQNRIKQFKQALKEMGLGGFIVTNPINIFYLTGFKGISQTEREAILIFSPKATLITARLYQTEANAKKSKDLSIIIESERDKLHEAILKLLTNARKVGFEQNDLKYAEFQKFKKNLKNSKLVPVENLVEKMRIKKSDEEISKIEKAQIISQDAFFQLTKTIHAGQTEEEIADTLQTIIKSLGGQGLSFESIIASGQNASKPHHTTGKRKIKKGEVLLLDFGAKYKNYCADLSRTVFIGSAKDEHKNVFWHVKNAQENALQNIKSETTSSDAFNLANNHFKSLKLEAFFTHGLGHGIGLEIHEPPYLRQSAKHPLENNMVFSVEPGLYMSWGGVRIEDLVAIKNNKAKVLGKKQDGLIIL